MSDQRRVLLAFLLMMAVLAGTQWWYSRMAPDPAPPAPADTTAAVPSLEGEEPARVATAPPAAPRPAAPGPDSVPADTAVGSAGSTSASAPRESRLYSFCAETKRVAPSSRATSSASASCHPVRLEWPM